MKDVNEFPSKDGPNQDSTPGALRRPKKPLPQAPAEEPSQVVPAQPLSSSLTTPVVPTHKPALVKKKPAAKVPVAPAKRRTSLSSDQVIEPLVTQPSSDQLLNSLPVQPSSGPAVEAVEPILYQHSSAYDVEVVEPPSTNHDFEASAPLLTPILTASPPKQQSRASRDSNSEPHTQSTSPRTNYFAKSARVSSPNTQAAVETKSPISAAGKQNLMGSRSSKTNLADDKATEKKGAAKSKSKNLHPVERVKRREDAQTESLKKLGNKEHPFYKAMAELRYALKEYREDSERMNALKAIMPDLKKKPDSPHFSSDSGDDVESPQKRSSGETQSSGSGQSGNTSASSADQDKALVGVLADLPVPSSSSDNSQGNSPEHPKKPSEPNNNNAPAAPTNVEVRIINPALAQPLTLAPLHFLFRKSEIAQVCAENDLANKPELLLPLTRLISAMRQLQGKFQGTDLIFKPLTQLCNYYTNAHQALLAAANEEQRSYILRDTACVTIFTGNKATHIEVEAAEGRKLLCITEEGNEVRENADGNRAVVLTEENVMKPNHMIHLKPGTENAIQSLYAMSPQDEDKPTGASSTLMVVSGVSVNENYNEKHLGDKVEFVNGRPTVRNTVQCGQRVYGMSFLNALRGLGAFGNWKNAIPEAELVTHLRTLETLYRQNPNSIKDINNWPEPLLLHSGRLGYDLAPMTTALDDDIFYVELKDGQLNYAVKKHGIKRGSISAAELPGIAGLKEPLDLQQLKLHMKDILNLTAERGHTRRPYAELPDNFKAIHALPNYSPETALRELPQVLFRLNYRNFLSQFKANLIADPTDLTPGNMFLCWNESENEFYLRCIDGDEVFEFPVTYNGGIHCINSKNVLYLLKHLLDQPMTDREIDEELEYTPLEQELFFCADLYKKNQGWNELIAEDILTQDDRFDPQQKNQSQGESQPAHLVARPQRADVETREMMLDVPMMFHVERFPMNLRMRENIASSTKKARRQGTPLTARILAREAKPATTLLYEIHAEPEVSLDDNYAESILMGLRKITSNAPTFEELFLNVERDILPFLAEHNAKRKYGADEKAQALKDYHRIAKQKGLKPLSELCKEVKLPLLDGLSLHDILAEHRHPPNAHTDTEFLRPVPKGVATLVETLQGSSVPKETDEILSVLELLGEHFPKETFALRWLPESRRPELLKEAIVRAMPGAFKFLMKEQTNLSTRYAEGETVLHILMRKHRDAPAKKVFETLKICLKSPTCDPQVEDSYHRTPLMAFIDAMNSEDPDYATQIVKLFKDNHVNLNQRATFKRKNRQNLNLPGTVLDYAIDSNNIEAFIALINQDATDLVDVAAAVRFVKEHKSHPRINQAVQLLKVQHPRFAFELAIEDLTTSEPDEAHPASCKITGATHGKRFLLKSAWDRLFDKEGKLNNKNSVSDGAHKVIPLSMQKEEKPLLYSKFYPEFPGLQRLVEIIFESLGCACTFSELWRVDSPDGKQTYPILLSTAKEGESLYDVLLDPRKRTDFEATFDMEHFTLLSTILMLVGQEDGHANQFKVIKMPSGKSRVVPIDFDRVFISAFIDNILLLKDVTFFLPQFLKTPLSPQSIATLICANGKRLPTHGLTQEAAELLIRENAARLFDHWTNEALITEDQHLKLFPRKDPLSQSCTRTGKEMVEEKDKKLLVSQFGNLLDRIDTAEDRQMNKTKADSELSFKAKSAASARSLFGIKVNYSIIGCPVEKRTPTVLHERYIQIARVLYKKSGAPFTGLGLFRFIRPDVYPLYAGVIKEGSRDNPCQHYARLVQIAFNQKKPEQGVPRSLSKQYDVFAVVTQPLSTKYRAQYTYDDFHDAAVFYKASKKRATDKALAVHAIRAGDTTALQACKSESEQESYVKSLQWIQGGPDNRAVLETIISLEIHFHELRLINCKDLTWTDLKKLLRISSTLEILNLTGCSGLNNLVINNDLFQLLADYCPMVKTVIISDTEVSRIEIDGSELPALTTLIARDCTLLKSIKIVNSQLETLDLEGCTEVTSLPYDYRPKEAMRRPLEEERPLKHLNIRGCTKIPGADITALLERAPYLSEFLHANNQKFDAITFGACALKQRRFNAGTFFAMIQNGVLDLCGLPFEDKDLLQFREWLCQANAPKITQFVVRSPCTFSRLAIFEFIVKVPSIVKVIYQGPFLQRRGRREQTWGIGLKPPIARILSLPNGMIGGFTDRVSQKSMKKGAVLFSFRMPDDSFKYLSGASEFEKHAEAKWLDKLNALPEGADLKGVAVMANGLLLLSMQEDKNFSYLLTLDPLTHERCALDVPEVKSFAGELCVINDKTFALQSDQLYLIHKTEIGWRIQHRLLGYDVGHPPVSNGYDLLAYCCDEDKHRYLRIIDIHTGECILKMRLQDKTNKVLRFVDPERLALFDGQYYSFLNVNTLELHALKPFRDSRPEFKYPEYNCQITNPRFAWVTVLPNRQLMLGGGQHCETLDFESLNRITHESLLNYTPSAFLITHLGDGILLDNAKGCLAQRTQYFFIIDLKYRQAHQKGYACSRDLHTPGRLNIITPAQIVINKKLDIDGEFSESDNGFRWQDNMASGKPTSTTFYDFILAFFEKYDALHKNEGQKPFVTFEDNIIHIDGLNDKEMNQLPHLLAQLWQHQPSMATTHRSLSFVSTTPGLPSLSAVQSKKPISVHVEEHSDTEDTTLQMYN